MSDGQPASAGEQPAGVTPYEKVQASPEFQDLRSSFRRFAFPMTAFFLAWYFLYVLLAVFAHDWMSTKLSGNITIGLVMGLLQFVSTFAITIIYVRWAGRTLDPKAERVHALAEKATGGDY